MAFFVLSRCFLDFSVGVGAFVIGISQISSFFSCNGRTHSGPKQRKQEEWISQQTWKRINKWMLRNRFFKASYKDWNSGKDSNSAIDREVKKPTKRDKIHFIANLTTESAKQCIDILYNITKVLAGGFSSTNTIDKTLLGEIITREQQKLERNGQDTSARY